MQPCEVCHGTTVDAGGYCERCRTYRGQPASATALTTFVPHSYEVVAPRPADPAPGHPPAGGAPTPSGPSPSGPSPSVPTPSGPGGPRSLLVPLVVLSATLVLLVAAIVVVGVLRSRTGTPVVARTGAASSGTAAPVDPCVVGTWEQVSMREDVAFDQVGTVSFTGAGATLVLRADGTGEIRYPAGITYRGDVRGYRYELLLTGSVTFTYTTVNGTLARSAIHPAGTATVRINGVEATSEPLAAEPDPSRYTCTGQALVEETATRRAEYTRRAVG